MAGECLCFFFCRSRTFLIYSGVKQELKPQFPRNIDQSSLGRYALCGRLNVPPMSNPEPKCLYVTVVQKARTGPAAGNVVCKTVAVSPCDLLPEGAPGFLPVQELTI